MEPMGIDADSPEPRHSGILVIMSSKDSKPGHTVMNIVFLTEDGEWRDWEDHIWSWAELRREYIGSWIGNREGFLRWYRNGWD